MSELTFERWADPVLEQVGQHATSAYAEEFWLPFIGPSALLLLRHVARRVDDGPYVVEVADLAAALGLGQSEVRHGPVPRTLDRLANFHLARSVGPGRWFLRSHIGPLSERRLARLPSGLRAAHADLVAAGAT